MSWRRPGRKDIPRRREHETEAPPVTTTEEDVRQAEQAAEEAARNLEAVRARRAEVERGAARLARLNRENGFAEMIRKAFGS